LRETIQDASGPCERGVIQSLGKPLVLPVRLEKV
jgi:hypothetical protein